VTGSLEQLHSRDRIRGYKEALEKNGIPYNEEIIFHGDLHKASGQEGIVHLLNLPLSLSAVLFANDNMAIAAMKVIKERGLSIPEDISIVGFDDIEAASQVDPPLSTVRQPPYRVGEEAAKLLLNIVDGKEKLSSKDTFGYRTCNPELL